MTNRNELEKTIRELREMELMQKELEAEIEALKDTLKAALNEAQEGWAKYAGHTSPHIFFPPDQTIM